MAKSDYSYSFDGEFLVIIDLNLGRMSVTNDIENVLAEIALEEGIDMNDYPVVYKDSEGTFDGVKINSQGDAVFQYLGTLTAEEAIAKARGMS